MDEQYFLVPWNTGIVIFGSEDELIRHLNKEANSREPLLVRGVRLRRLGPTYVLGEEPPDIRLALGDEEI